MKRSLIALCVMAVAFSASAYAQDLKIGYVNSQKIFEGLPEAQEAQKRLDARLGQWQDSLDAMIKSFQEEYQAFEAQQGLMADEAKQARQQELLAMQNEVQQYRQRIFGNSGEAAQLRDKILAPLQEKVLVAIKEVAKAEKVNFMFDKIEDATIMLYADEKFDYTFKVLDVLKRGNN